MPVTLITKIAEYGITFFAIVSIIYIVCTFNKTIQNHMSHMTDVLHKLEGSINKLEGSMEILIKILGNR